MKPDCCEKKNIGLAFLIFTVFAVMFTLSLLTPMVADDYNYAFGYADDTRISSLQQIWDSMYWHRKYLNGRVFAHGWLSFVLMYPRWVFGALNAAVASFFSWTTVRFCSDRGCLHAVRAAAFAWLLLWVCMPGFGQVFFWTAGACNYFWGFTFAWFVIWRAEALDERTEKRKLRLALLLLPTFVAGAWSEHISFAMLVALFLLGLDRWRREAVFPWCRLVFLVSGGLGYLYLMLAPSSQLLRRLKSAGKPGGTGNLAKLMDFIPGGLAIPVMLLLLMSVFFLVVWKKQRLRQNGFILFLGIGLLFAAAAMLYAVKSWNNGGIFELVSSSQVSFFLLVSVFFTYLAFAAKKKVDRNRIIFSLILAFSGFCGLILFAFGEYFPVRGFCAPVMMLTLAGVFLAESLPKKNRSSRVPGIVLVLAFILSFLLGVSDIVAVHRQAVHREEIFKAAAAGDKIVVTGPYAFRTKYTAQFGNPDLSYDAGWPNGVMADYYDVVRIIVE